MKCYVTSMTAMLYSHITNIMYKYIYSHRLAPKCAYVTSSFSLKCKLCIKFTTTTNIYKYSQSTAKDASSIERLPKHYCCSCLKMRALVVCLSRMLEYIRETFCNKLAHNAVHCWCLFLIYFAHQNRIICTQNDLCYLRYSLC